MANLPVSSARLSELEKVIDAGLSTFLEVGNALVAIRDEGLFLASHRSFAVYCKERWGLSPAAAWRRMDQARAVAELPADTPPPSQRARARERKASKESPRRARATRVIDVTEPEPEGPPVRYPRLAGLLAAMDALEPTVAAGVADDDIYRRLLSWARTFQSAYQDLHPRRPADPERPVKPARKGPCDHPLFRRSKGTCLECGVTVTAR